MLKMLKMLEMLKMLKMLEMLENAKMTDNGQRMVIISGNPWNLVRIGEDSSTP